MRLQTQVTMTMRELDRLKVIQPLCANVERDIFVGLIRVWG
jgi:hypothetical protein